ncbi:methyl-accepting chemotaxis protein [Pseudoalteromonas sp. '520P1 No. 412']|uniref:methyl-accepting chemotaxis protein n=1 Tax=unclassified Pseudoalteromonas TaxID=194690 RepID=UPI0009E20028
MVLEEKELATSNEQLAAINKSLAVIEFNIDGTIITANDNFLMTLGYRLDEIQGQHHSMFVDPEYKASIEYQQFWAKLNRGEYDNAEYKRIGNEGKEVWIQASYNPILDSQGKVCKIVKFATDITATKLAMSDFQGQISAIDKSHAVIEFNLDGIILNANDNFLNTVDYQLNEIKGKQHSMFVEPEYKASSEYQQFWDKLNRGEFQTGEYKRIGKFGKEIWIQASYNPIFDLNGNVYKVVKFATDVTSTKLIMADFEGQISAIDKSQAVIEFNMDGTIINANDNFLNTVGYQLNEIKGQHHSMFVEPEYKVSSEYQQFWQKLNRGEFEADEFKRIGQGGKEIWIQASYNPIFDLNGKPFKVVKYASDITEQKNQAAATALIARTVSALDVCQANVMMADADYNIVYVNEAVTAMLSTNEQQLRTVLPRFNVASLIGTNIDTFHKNPAHQRGMLDNLKSTYQTDLELAGFTFGLIATPVFNNNGERLGTVVEWEDKTERLTSERAERAEAAENLRIKQALDNVSANAMIADAGNNIIFMNEAVQRMMRDAEADIRTDLPNFNSNNLVGQNVDVFHKNPAHQQNMLKNLASTYKTEIVVGGRTFSLIANPIISDNGERVGTVVEWNDRTAEVAIEKEIDEIIASAGRGELDARLEEGDKSGFFLNLTQGLNTLVEIVDDAVAETGFMLDAMAHGDLTKRIEKDYQGSFDKLKRDANTTAEKLTEVIDQINTSATLVASGAEEISQGNADLSQRTEEQASSLEETASSMEEMTSTVRQNADNAKVANELAANTQEQASQGGQVVQRAVNSMAEINDSSKKISDIIGVIDEIAFQTNLLALNAAVEAARAGEQGRGFAVVAGEVRNLAQRSAAAAKEIKELIRDSVSKVEDGTLLVNESGTTLQKIVLSVQKVTEMIADITVASEEQSSGIEQVNKAITQMDEMTQQNAALVEEASAAGESMAEQANGMRQLLTFFKSNAGGNASALPVSTYSKPAPKVAAPSRTQRLSSPSTGDDFVDSADEWEEF